MLYIVSTPIGNLSDITLRAIETLKSVDLILCEDTRVSKNLLNAYQISAPLWSYHSFNEKKQVDEIIDRLNQGQNIALISDAGTPLIQDPGYILVDACQKNNIPYTSLPGPSSIIAALVLSGFPIEKFQFTGFLSKKTQDAKNQLSKMMEFGGLSVFFESPKRVTDTLNLLTQIDPEQPLCVIREITKKFETVHKGTAESLLKEFSLNEPRGEIVFVIQGKEKSESIHDLTPIALELLEHGLSKKTAYSMISKLGFVNKDALYKH